MKNHIERGIQGSTVRAYHGQAGWIIEFIHPQIQNNRAQLLNQIENLLNNTPNNVQKDIVWKLFLYSMPEERFKEHGTLHTNQEEYDGFGNSIITLGAGDAYVDLTEFDCEIISFNDYHGLAMLSRVSLNDQGNPILPFIQGTQYLWLEAMGGHYGVQTVVPDQNTPGHLTITLRS